MGFYHLKRAPFSSPLIRSIPKLRHRTTRYPFMPHTKQSERVHVLGLGSIGTFAAHALFEIPNKPAVTLLFHRESLLHDYQENGCRIALTAREGSVIAYDSYDVEVYREGKWHDISSSWLSPEMMEPPISNLVVSVKATQTTRALKPLKRRLSANSTILFLQNGCGMIDEVNRELFPNPPTRPNYIVGVISHGVTLNRPFHVTHTGKAAVSLGLIPRISGFKHPLDSSEHLARYFLDQLPLSPRLNATSYAYTEVLQTQLEKLAVNAFCNPLCALNDAKNGFLFTLPNIRRDILTEIAQVVLALPELQGISRVQERFSVNRLEATVNEILTKTAETTCSMVWDLRAGRETEIKFINGYWVRRGSEVGVQTPVNEDLMREILRRQSP